MHFFKGPQLLALDARMIDDRQRELTRRAEGQLIADARRVPWTVDALILCTALTGALLFATG